MTAGGTPPKTGSQPAAQPPEPVETPESRLEGLRAWIAQVDRKLGIRSYAGGAAIVLALAAGIAGVVLASSAKDESATKDEVQALRDQVESVQQETASEAEQDIASLGDRVDDLEARIAAVAADQRTTESELTVVQDDIADLRTEIAGLRSSGQDSGN